MNGPHDLGGQMGFGPINPEQNEPWFHHDWERRAFGLTLAIGATGSWSLDESRHSRENLPPPVYLSSSYYRIWTLAIERLMKNKGLITDTDIKAGHAIDAPLTLKRVLKADMVTDTLSKGGPVDRPTSTDPAFQPGDQVQAKNIHPVGHTRLPRYVRGHTGVIKSIHGCHVFPDSNAQGDGENPQWLYNVEFKSHDLWGEDADPTLVVMVDLWEPYLNAI